MEHIRQTHMAKSFASMLVNNNAHDFFKNRHVVDVIYTQFMDWPDLCERVTKPMFLVELISCSDGTPDFKEVLNYCVSADRHIIAAMMVEELTGINFKITMPKTQYYSDNYMLQVSFWNNKIYGSKKFEIV